MYIGINHQLPKIGISQCNVVHTNILLKDYVRCYNSKRVKRGHVEKSIDMKNSCYVAEILTNNGLKCLALYTDEEELSNLRFLVVYVSEKRCQLNVHHKRYILGKMAWEYEENDLVTLCQEYHLKIHQNLPVNLYNASGNNLQIVHLTPCSRCSGTGYFPEYRHVDNGICFRYKGNRFEEFVVEEMSEYFDEL